MLCQTSCFDIYFCSAFTWEIIVTNSVKLKFDKPIDLPMKNVLNRLKVNIYSSFNNSPKAISIYVVKLAYFILSPYHVFSKTSLALTTAGENPENTMPRR